jgi:hypothetical protein
MAFASICRKSENRKSELRANLPNVRKRKAIGPKVLIKAE